MTQKEYMDELEKYQQMEAELEETNKNIEKNKIQQRSSGIAKASISQSRAGQSFGQGNSLTDKRKKLEKKQTNLEKEMELSKTRLEKYGGEI